MHILVFFIWIFIIGPTFSHVRHERTRYMSGRNLIFAGSYYPRTDSRTYHWDRPLQLLESSVYMPNKYSKRPLFSWDDISQKPRSHPTTPAPLIVENRFPQVSRYPNKKIDEHDFQLSNNLSNDIPPYTEIRRIVPQSPKPYRKRKRVHHNKKGSVSYRNSYVYNPPHPQRSTNLRNKYKPVSKRLLTSDWSYDRIKRKCTNSKKCAKVSRKFYEKGKENNEVVKMIGGNSNLEKIDRHLLISKIDHVKSNSESNILTTTETLAERTSLGTSAEPVTSTQSPKVLTPNLLTTTSTSTEEYLTTAFLEPEVEVGETCENSSCEHVCKIENGMPVCSCHDGFTLNGTSCEDVDECLNNNGGCEGLCTNTNGSRKCSCAEGFRSSGEICLDVNECLSRNGHGLCQDQCINTVGSFICTCENLPGTKLGEDKISCESINECDSAGCSHSCISTFGRAFCTCPDGYELGSDWKTCHDIDECNNSDDHNANCQFGCINTIGSYQCELQNSSSTTEEYVFQSHEEPD